MQQRLLSTFRVGAPNRHSNETHHSSIGRMSNTLMQAAKCGPSRFHMCCELTTVWKCCHLTPLLHLHRCITINLKADSLLYSRREAPHTHDTLLSPCRPSFSRGCVPCINCCFFARSCSLFLLGSVQAFMVLHFKAILQFLSRSCVLSCTVSFCWEISPDNTNGKMTPSLCFPFKITLKGHIIG